MDQNNKKTQRFRNSFNFKFDFVSTDIYLQF